jgi:hypothetical protein
VKLLVDLESAHSKFGLGVAFCVIATVLLWYNNYMFVFSRETEQNHFTRITLNLPIIIFNSGITLLARNWLYHVSAFFLQSFCQAWLSRLQFKLLHLCGGYLSGKDFSLSPIPTHQFAASL